MGRDTAVRQGRAQSLSETDLRRLVRAILLEASPPPDEPSVKPGEAMGQYLMPGERTELAYAGIEERDTALERDFEYALQAHYRGNHSAPLAKVWPRVWQVAQSGLYSRWLQPPAGSIAYRGIGGLDPRTAARVIGLSVKELKAEPGRAHRVEGSPPAFRAREPISSWTLRADVQNLMDFTTRNTRDGQVAVLFAARCEPMGAGGGQFLLNPRTFTQDFFIGEEFKDEVEVLAYGPVELAALSYIYYDDDESDLRDIGGRKRDAKAAADLLAALAL